MRGVSFAADERASWRMPVAHEAVFCTGLAATAASLLVWLGPPGGDLAAHEYQRALFLGHGFTLWNNFWYAGRYAFVGYSVLYYPLAGLLGIRLLAVLTVALAAAPFALLLEREWGRAARWPSRSFALVWAGTVITGELPFALGVALALLALLALRAGWRWTGAVLTLLVVAASPVALLLLAVVLAGILVVRRAPFGRYAIPGLGLGVAAAAELLLLRLFPLGGGLAFPWYEAAAAGTFCVIGIALVWRIERAGVLRGVFSVYLATVALTFVVPSGLGDNVNRLRYLALPLALLTVSLRRWRPLPVALAAVLLAGAWNVSPLAAGWTRSAADRSSRAAVGTRRARAAEPEVRVQTSPPFFRFNCVASPRLAETMPRLTPSQPISPNRRPYSILGQRFITTSWPAALARSAAASSRTPSCIQITGMPSRTASSATAPASSERRKIETMSGLTGSEARSG